MALEAAGRILQEVYSERARQIGLGYDDKHDDQHSDELLHGGIAYATLHDPQAYNFLSIPAKDVWPFEESYFKPNTPRRGALIKSLAFIVAEIERSDREALALVKPAFQEAMIDQIVQRNYTLEDFKTAFEKRVGASWDDCGFDDEFAQGWLDSHPEEIQEAVYAVIKKYNLTDLDDTSLGGV